MLKILRSIPVVIILIGGLVLQSCTSQTGNVMQSGTATVSLSQETTPNASFATPHPTIDSVSNDQRPTEYFEDGIEAIEKGDIEDAIRMFDQALTLKSDFVEAYIQRGIAKDLLGDADGALSDLNKAIELNPNEADAYNARGNIYANQDNLELALADYNKSIELEPTLTKAYINRASILTILGEYDKALADLEKAESLDPSIPPIYYNRGLVYLELGDLEKALQDFKNYTQMNTEDAMGFYYLAGVSAELDNIDDSIFYISKAIDIEQIDIFYLLRAKLYLQKRLDDNAIADLRKVLAISENEELKNEAQSILSSLGISP